jgi:hypothetical protein
MSDVKAVDVVPETAVAVLNPDNLGAMVKDADQPIYKAMSGLESLDWKNLKPNQTAILLMQRPMAVSGGGTMYLNLRQALYFAVRAYELGVSPFSSAVWFDPAKFSVNLTLEGKREVARLRGIDLGPPSFEEVSREWKDIPKMTDGAEEVKKAGFTKDMGIKCRIRVGKPEHKEYTEYIAWISEWYQPKSPLWKGKPTHMLQTRAQEKAITAALGTGASTMPDEKDLE